MTESSSTPPTHRQAALRDVEALIASLQARPDAGALTGLIEEAQSLSRAIAAFHMEAIRFRMYNVDRLLATLGDLPSDITSVFADLRKELEAAGFHTRSH